MGTRTRINGIRRVTTCLLKAVLILSVGQVAVKAGEIVRPPLRMEQGERTASLHQVPSTRYLASQGIWARPLRGESYVALAKGDVKPRDEDQIAPPAETIIKIKPKELELLSSREIEVVAERINYTLLIFGTLITTLVGIFGILMGLLQYTNQRRTREELIEAKQFIRDNFDAWKTNVAADLDKERRQLEDTMTEHLSEVVEKLYKDRYATEIAKYTRALTAEVLMMTPDSRGILLARLRRMTNSMRNVMKTTLDKRLADTLFEISGRAIEDWHTLGQLYSPDENQLKTGLLSLRVNPIVEALDHLTLLRSRYEKNPEIFQLVIDAISSVEAARKAA